MTPAGPAAPRLDAPIPREQIRWRQDGRPLARDGKFFARFVPYIDANTVRERLDAHGESWSLSLEVLPPGVSTEGSLALVAFKAHLTVGQVVREDVGQGSDYKAASTDAFKRAGARFGIGAELARMPAVVVEMDGDGRYAKPLENPADAYARKTAARGTPAAGTPAAPPAPAKGDAPACPKCGGAMYDNRKDKRNPNAPDYKCKKYRDRQAPCDGAIWPPDDREPADPAEEYAGGNADDLPFD